MKNPDKMSERELRLEVKKLRDALGKTYAYMEHRYQSAAMRRARTEIQRIAKSAITGRSF